VRRQHVGGTSHLRGVVGRTGGSRFGFGRIVQGRQRKGRSRRISRMKTAVRWPGSAVCRVIIVGSTCVEGRGIVGVSIWARGCTSIGTTSIGSIV
jgi:hypothetical protein